MQIKVNEGKIDEADASDPGGIKAKGIRNKYQCISSWNARHQID